MMLHFRLTLINLEKPMMLTVDQNDIYLYRLIDVNQALTLLENINPVIQLKQCYINDAALSINFD